MSERLYWDPTYLVVWCRWQQHNGCTTAAQFWHFAHCKADGAKFYQCLIIQIQNRCYFVWHFSVYRLFQTRPQWDFCSNVARFGAEILSVPDQVGQVGPGCQARSEFISIPKFHRIPNFCFALLKAWQNCKCWRARHGARVLFVRREKLLWVYLRSKLGWTSYCSCTQEWDSTTRTSQGPGRIRSNVRSSAGWWTTWYFNTFHET